MSSPAKLAAKCLLVAGVFLAGYMASRVQDPTPSLASNVQSSKYLCPMHPEYVSLHSGACPVCGMSLVPADQDPGRENSAGAVGVSAEKLQMAGVRTEETLELSGVQRLRAAGRVAVDEQRLYRILAASDGWIRRLGNNPAGTFVARNEFLASYYAQNLQTAQQALMAAATYAERAQGVGAPLPPAPVNATLTTTSNYNGIALGRPAVTISLQNAIDGLRALGMHDAQIERISKKRDYESEILIAAPTTGYVLSRNLSPDQRFDKGDELYRIANVSRVWVMADIFEKDREFLKPGIMARVRYRDREFHARLSETLPQFDAQSRTLKTRFEVENPESILLPDMYVDVELEMTLPKATSVPATAVIDSGVKKTVYVEKARGVFEPRLVETGMRWGDRVEIVKGLALHEKVVASGNFLIDSESRMRHQEAPVVRSDSAPAAVKDLVCGMEVDPRSPETLKTTYKGKAYFFCAAMCKKRFEANPEQYIAKTNDDQVRRTGMGQ